MKASPSCGEIPNNPSYNKQHECSRHWQESVQVSRINIPKTELALMQLEGSSRQGAPGVVASLGKLTSVRRGSPGARGQSAARLPS